MTFADIIRHHAAHPGTADRPALVFRGEAWTYRDLSRRANRVARALCALGVAQGQQVALLLPNRPELFEIFAAACRLGAAIVPIGIRLTAREVAYMVNHAEARVLVFDSQLQDLVQSLRTHLPSVLPPGSVGEIFKRGMPYVEAFFKNPQADAAIRRGEWVTAGDVGYLDPDGYLTLVDRKRDLIITGGLNVYPSEVEALVAEHPAVRECAVVGVSDERWGEAVHAVVVLRDGPPAGPAGEAAAQEALLSHCRRNLAGYKCPKRFTFVAELPKSHVGKLLRRRLREALLAGMGAETPVEGR